MTLEQALPWLVIVNAIAALANLAQILVHVWWWRE